MDKQLGIFFDQSDIDSIAADFDLRGPNKRALRQLVLALTDDDFDRHVPQVMNLATGVGKTYLMAAFIEYLRRQGVCNVMIVTPSLTVQSKTIQNFSAGTKRYIPGAGVPPEVVTPQDYSAWRVSLANADLVRSGGNDPSMAFIFNIQQLIAPKDLDGDTTKATNASAATRVRRFVEDSGSLFEYLQSLPNLVVIADESHLYGTSAKKFNAALKELDPAAIIGLTASAQKGDHIVFKYPLYEAISDRFVKTPVLAFRKKGYGADEASEEQQLRDAVALLKIKQQAYDTYIAEQGLEPLNAVLFVVCADVNHATQVTELLRSSEHFGSQLAVLQVDNEHNDAATQRLLDDLDAPDSQVRAVVSVNKLKEGWDVKNIAVVVTLRAMASEVLTQQTMGRGLRLPFGKYTDVFHIDQLDIISHHSFVELLENEEVLHQFGLDDAVSPDQAKAVRQAIQQIATPTSPAANAEASSTGPAASVAVGGSSDAPQASERAAGVPAGQGSAAPGAPVSASSSGPQATLLMTAYDSDIAEAYGQVPLGTLDPIERTTDFEDVSFQFPRVFLEPVDPLFELHKIPTELIQEAARRVTDSKDVLQRREIKKSKLRRLTSVDVESAEVDSLPVESDNVRIELVRFVMNQRVVPATNESKRSAERSLIPEFMRETRITQWTVKAYESAERELGELVRAYAKDLARQRTTKIVLSPVTLPEAEIRYLPLGAQVQERIEASTQFQRGAFYGDWRKSLFQVESFDSFSGEYKVAQLLDTSPQIAWWLRLHTTMRASIKYNLHDSYYPDFVARDTEGIYWIIEGKDARGRNDDTVQAKRKAAEEVVRYLVTRDEYADQAWGYLIAYEDDVASSDSWADLKAKAQPVTNA